MQKQLILGAVLLLACLAARADVENQNEIDSLLLQWESTMDQSLDEVVVTGQGSAVSKRRLSSNITKLSASDLEHLRASRIDQMLQNALPNVQFTLTTGQPGTTSMIKSRGLSSAFTNSTPVIYVDGVRVDNLNTGASLFNVLNNAYGNISGQTAASGAIGDIPMENIDHIEYVPGGAATTLYGSDAANGVLQIFTKKNGSGRFEASVSAQFGASVANSQFYHFDRTKQLLHQTGFEQRYGLSISGGNERMGYSLGASMSQDLGTIIHNGNEQRKYDIRFGSAITLCDPLKYTNSFGFVAEDYRRNRNGNQGYYTGLWFAEGGAAANFTYTGTDGQQHNFPADIDAATPQEFELMRQFVSTAEQLQDHKESVKRFQTSQQLEYTPLKGLTFHDGCGVFLHLLLGQVDQQVGDKKYRLVLIFSHAQDHCLAALFDDHAVDRQRQRHILIFFDAAVIVRVQIGNLAVLIQGILLDVQAGRIDVGAEYVHAALKGLRADLEKDDRLIHPDAVDLVSRRELSSFRNSFAQLNVAVFLGLVDKPVNTLPLRLSVI